MASRCAPLSQSINLRSFVRKGFPRSKTHGSVGTQVCHVCDEKIVGITEDVAQDLQEARGLVLDFFGRAELGAGAQRSGKLAILGEMVSMFSTVKDITRMTMALRDFQASVSDCHRQACAWLNKQNSELQSRLRIKVKNYGFFEEEAERRVEASLRAVLDRKYKPAHKQAARWGVIEPRWPRLSLRTTVGQRHCMRCSPLNLALPPPRPSWTVSMTG